MRASLVLQWKRICLPITEDVGLSLSWKDPWRRKWQLTPVFLPGKSGGQRSLADSSSWGRKSQTRLSN